MDIHASRKAVEELNSLYAEMNGYKIEPPKEKLKTDRNMFNIPKSEQDAARERIKAKTAAKRAKMSEGDAADEASMKKFQALQKNVDQKRKLNIRGNDSAEQKARLEKKRGMKLDDHPQYKTEALDPVGKEDGDVNNDGKKDSTDSYLMKRRKAIGKAMGKKEGMKEDVEEVQEGDGDPCWDSHKQVGMKKKGGRMVPNCVPKTKKESFSDWRSELVEVIDKKEQDQQIKEKNVKNKVVIDPELKLEQVAEELGGEVLELIELDEEIYEMIKEAVYGGTQPEKKDTRMTVTNADKKANTPAYQKMKAGDKRYKAADHMGEEVEEVDEAMRAGPRQRAMRDKTFQTIKKGGGTYSSRDRATAHNVGVRGDHKPGDVKRSTGGKGVKGDKGMGYGDRGAGNKARRRAGEQPMRGNRDPRTTNEEASDAMKDRRMERGGVDGNNRYDRAPKPANTAGKKKPYDGMSALDVVKAQIRAKHGKGAIMDTKKK